MSIISQTHPKPKLHFFSQNKNVSTTDPNSSHNRFMMFHPPRKTEQLLLDMEANLPYQESHNPPPPGTYQLSSDFQKQKSGISFGKGRQNVQFGSFLQGSKSKKFIPSPDKYTVPLPLSKVSGKIFCKLPTQLDFISKKKTPGPGTYDPKGCHVAESGSYILSQMKNTGSPRLYTINSASVDRIGRKRNSSQLSPTTYDTLQKQRGKYYSSKHKNLQVRSFGKSLRDGPQDKSKKNFPGFRYKRFSQFGSYA